MQRFISLALIGAFLGVARESSAQEFEQEPIRYSQTEPENRVSRLMERLKSGEAKLPFDEQFGYLRSLLSALDVPVSSQMLVFSKTSFQRNRIGPRTPRARAKHRACAALPAANG